MIIAINYLYVTIVFANGSIRQINGVNYFDNEHYSEQLEHRPSMCKQKKRGNNPPLLRIILNY